MESKGEKEDAPERRGFWDRVNFLLGALEKLTKRKRVRKKDMQKSINSDEYQNKDK